MSTVVGARSERSAVRIALVGLAIMAVAMLLAVNFGRLPLVGGGPTYRAEFRDASGLKIGEEVRVAGIKVGQVTDIELGRGKVVVSFRVKDEELGDRTTASIEVKTLLGQHYLAVAPAGSGTLERGGTIPLERTTTPVDIVPAFQQLTSTVQELDTGQVAAAFDSLSEVLSTSAPEVRATLDGLARLSRSVSSRDAEIRSLFDIASQVSGVVAARDAELAQLLRDSTDVLQVLDDRQASIDAIIDGTASLSGQLSGLVRDNEAEIGPALDQLNDVLVVLRKNERAIDDIVKYGSVYAREFVNVGGTGRWFDATLKFPRGAAVCSTGGTPLLGVLDPILSALNGAVNGSDSPCLPLGPATEGEQ